MENIFIFNTKWWQEPLGTWMAWNKPTVAFFVFIALAIATMTILEIRSPGGNFRRGIFMIDTTRGDRLFISLLGSAFILLTWIALYGVTIWGGAILSLAWSFLVFKKA
jgi:predicted small integral membrane protein